MGRTGHTNDFLRVAGLAGPAILFRPHRSGGVYAMLHIRLVSPATLTAQIADSLAAAPGVQNVVIQAGAACGDSVGTAERPRHDAPGVAD